MPEVPLPEWLSLTFWTSDPESVRNLFVIVGGVIGLVLLMWRTYNVHRQTSNDRERRITDSFTRAIEQLGSDKLATRLGAIYALEQIARDSRGRHWPIMETLTAYVRERAPWPPVQTLEEKEDRRRPDTDIDAILTVISRRRRRYDRDLLDLRETDLRGVFLSRGHLGKVFLYRAHLEGASLLDVNLRGAKLNDAHLEQANLETTNLTQKQFDSAISDETTHLPSHIKRRPPARKVAEGPHEPTATQKAAAE
jgi:Pentapeptide repeats (8 copies)